MTAVANYTREERAARAKALWDEPAMRAQMIEGMIGAWRFRSDRIVVTDVMLSTIHECNNGRTGQREVAKRIGIGRHSFLRILKVYGIKWQRPSGGSRSVHATPEILTAIHKARDGGLTLTLAAEHIGIGRNTLRRMIAEHGIKWRKPIMERRA
jgi:DNA-binding protein Fis